MQFSSRTTVGEVMTLYPYTVEYSASLTEARHRMEEYRVRHLPVVEQGRAKSVISRRELDAALALRSENELVVADVCALEMYSVDEATLLSEVLRAMSESRINSVVVTSAGRVAGIFTSSDACQYFADLLAVAKQ